MIEFYLMSSDTSTAIVRDFDGLSRGDVAWAGGKGANLGELTAAGRRVPPGFVIGAAAFARFLDESGLREKLRMLFAGLEAEDAAALESAAHAARDAVEKTEIPGWARVEISGAYSRLAGESASPPVAVRSSATSEDTAAASFAGMNETFLNVCGEGALLSAVRSCWSSLFGARTLYYRAKRGFELADIDIAVIVQLQIESRVSGVMFTVDPTGDRENLVIEGSFGLGEAIVSGQVTPDRFIVNKRSLEIVNREIHAKELAIEYDSGGGTVTRMLTAGESAAAALTDGQALDVARAGVEIERHYGEPQDIEWAFDGEEKLWILQSRPITTLGSGGAATAGRNGGAEAAVLVSGRGAAPGGATGAARVVHSAADARQLQPGEVLVTRMTAPDWAPYMRKAAAVVTDSGGMTCHAAIVSREFGTPCVVGTGDATSKLTTGAIVTVDGTAGKVYAGEVRPRAGTDSSGGADAGATPQDDASGVAIPPGGASARAMPPTTAAPTASTPLHTKLLVNLSEPSQAESAAGLPVDGVGLLRAELMVLEALDGDHPRLLIEENRAAEFVRRMADALTTFARAFSPRPITYRTIDFRSNEFAGLRGGDRFEPQEANPMIGYRGALRYTREPEVFNLELAALKSVWDAGLTNLHVMLPFVRTAKELETCRDLMLASGLLAGDPAAGPELWVMAEVPSVLFNIERYASLGIAGISVGTNDLTQLLLGADRDSELLADTFDERDPAVTEYLRQLIPRARAAGLKTSICGQAPSVHPEYAALLVEAGIDAISVSIDVVERARGLIAAAETAEAENRR